LDWFENEPGIQSSTVYSEVIVLLGQKIVVVLPAYQAEKTLRKTVEAIPREIVDEIILVDDSSSDATAQIGASLGIKTFRHNVNLGYGANQKTCYTEALRAGADVVIMLHPDYQYDPRLIPAMASMVVSGIYDVVLASRILGNGALSGGMPLYKYVCNRALTAFQNFLMGQKISEYHTGYRAFSRGILDRLPLRANSDDFVFDNQMLAQAIAFGYQVGEISCPTKYFREASSISFRRSIVYGAGVVATTILYTMWKCRLRRPPMFSDRPTLRLQIAFCEEIAAHPNAGSS
jgi:glycosyltransferase involved in cell wall biosynthesis